MICPLSFEIPIRWIHPKQRFLSCIKPNCRGFTLIEVLLAFFIFSIVAATVFGSYRSVFSGADTVLRSVSDDEAGLLAMHRMRLDFSSLVVLLPPLYRFPESGADPDPYRFMGKREWIGAYNFSSVRFTSLTHLPKERGLESDDAVSMIRYFVEASGTDRFLLKRSSRVYPFFQNPSAPPAYTVCDGVRSLEITFFDETGSAFERWDSESPDFSYATPTAVRIRLELGDTEASRIYETRIHLPLFRAALEG